MQKGGGKVDLEKRVEKLEGKTKRLNWDRMTIFMLVLNLAFDHKEDLLSGLSKILKTIVLLFP